MAAGGSSECTILTTFIENLSGHTTAIKGNNMEEPLPEYRLAVRLELSSGDELG